MTHEGDSGPRGKDDAESPTVPTGVPSNGAGNAERINSLGLRALIVLCGVIAIEAIWIAVVKVFGVPGAAAITVAAGFAATTMATFFTVHREEFRAKKETGRAVTISVATALIIIGVAVLLIIGVPQRHTKSSAGPTTTISTGPSPSTPLTTSADQPKFGPLKLDDLCSRPNPSDHKVPDYLLCVMNWCQGGVFFPNGAPECKSD